MVGAIMKGGHGNYMHGGGANGSSSRKRWNNAYLLILIIFLVFGAAVHRIQDRRMFNILIKEKDAKILSLYLLLQKERELVGDDKMKINGMKMKIYSLRGQNKELNGRISEMQSTISSLKDEQKIIELALEEKQNETNLLREKYTQVTDQNPQAKDLTEMLRQKEAEIEDLKQHQSREKSEDTQHESIEHPNYNDAISTENDASRNGDTESLMRNAGHRENGRLTDNGGEINKKEKYEKLEISDGTDVENRSGQVEQKDDNTRNSESSGAGKERDATEMTGNVANEEHKPKDEDSDRKNSTDGDAQSRKMSNSQGSDDQEFEVYRGGVKMEMQDESARGNSRFRVKHRYLKGKGNRSKPASRETERKKNLGSNEVTITANQRFVKQTEGNGYVIEKGKPINQLKRISTGLDMKNESISENQHAKVNTDENIEDSPPSIKLQNNINSIDSEYVRQNVSKAETVKMSREVEKGWEGIFTNSSSMKQFKEVPTYTANSEFSGSSSGGKEPHLQENEQFKQQYVTKNKNDDIRAKEKVEHPEDNEMNDFEETETGDVTSKESVSGVEKDGEEYEGQTEESEF